MSFFGPAAAQSLANLNEIRRRQTNPNKRAESRQSKDAPKPGAVDDEVILHTEALDAARNLKDNSNEEAHEDRQEHDNYSTAANDPNKKPHLDLEA